MLETRELDTALGVQDNCNDCAESDKSADMCAESGERRQANENVMGGQSGASPHVKVEVFSKIITSYMRKGCLTRPRRQPVRCPHLSKLSGICAVREAAIGKRREGLRRMCWLCVV